jgi:hypothetical protein
VVVLAGKKIEVNGELIQGLKIETKGGIQFVSKAGLEKLASKKVVKDLLSEYRER